jgi:chaperone modulatory protein CbpM
MSIVSTEAVWLDERQQFSLAELADLSGLSEGDLRQLIDYAALLPVDAAADPGAAEVRFSADCLVTARTACRLRSDFDLDAGGLALTLTLLNRIRDLEAQLRTLSAQFPHRHK